MNFYFKMIAVVPFLISCSSVHFGTVAKLAQSTSLTTDPLPHPSTSTDLSSCIPKTIEAITRNTKIIFLMDTSGSNRLSSMEQGTLVCSATDSSCAPPTDPDKTLRSSAIQRFLNTYGSKTNFSWGFITFSGTTAQTLLHGGQLISNSPNDLQLALNTFDTVTDDGATPYKAALQLATQAIASDTHQEGSPQYMVVLITDGFPTDYNQSPRFDFTSLNTDISQLLNAAAGRVSLSTIVYGTVNDSKAVSLLEFMAHSGGGQFANAKNSASGIVIDDVIPGTTTACTSN